MFGCVYATIKPENLVQLRLQFRISLEVFRSDDLLQRVFLSPDAFEGFIVQCSARRRRKYARSGEFGLIVVGITFYLTDLQFEVSAFPHVEWVNGTFISKLRVHQIIEFIKDLFTELPQENLTLVLRISRILHDIDVSVVAKTTFLFTNGFFIGFVTRVPEFRVELCDRVFLTKSRKRVLDVPTTRTLEAVIPHTNERHILTLRSRKESNDSITVAGLIGVALPVFFVGAVGLVGRTHLLKLRVQLFKRRRTGFLKSRE